MMPEVLDRPCSTSVALTATVTDGETRWNLTISDQTTDGADALLARLTNLKPGGFKTYLAMHPEAGLKDA